MVDDLDKKLRAWARATDDVRPTDAFTGTVVDGLGEVDPLAALASATGGLTLPDDFSESVMARVMSAAADSTGEASEEALLRIAHATADLQPSEDFTSSVLAAIAEVPLQAGGSAGFYQGVAGSARAGLFFAAAAAAACVLLSWYTQRDFDTQLMLQADRVEVAE